MSDDDKEIDFTKWTGDEKLAAFAKLGKLLCGVAAPLDEAKGQWFVPIAAEFKANEQQVRAVNPQLDCKLRRLQIFEPEVERRLDLRHYVAETKTTIVKRWLRKDVVTVENFDRPREFQSDIVRETVKRGGWSVDCILAGSRFQLSSYSTLSGDAFNGDAKFDFDGESCPTGLAISISVKNLRPYAAPFRACLVVERIEKKSKPEKFTDEEMAKVVFDEKS